jgi:hypothetical protein
MSFGEFPKKKGEQGKRTDLEEAMSSMGELATSSNAALTMYERHPEVMLKYGRRCIDYLALKRKQVLRRQQRKPVEVFVFWGDPGLGKTRRALWEAERDFGADEVYFKPAGKWWGLYDGEQVMVWDEFDGSQCTPTEFLKICDRYFHVQETKGGFVTPDLKRIYITSNFPIEEWWKVARETNPGAVKWDAVQRRIKESIHFIEEWKPKDKAPLVEFTENQEGMDWGDIEIGEGLPMN